MWSMEARFHWHLFEDPCFYLTFIQNLCRKSDCSVSFIFESYMSNQVTTSWWSYWWILNYCICIRYAVLDLILRTIEALSVVDEYSQQLCQNKELFQLLNELVKLPDKIEVCCCFTNSSCNLMSIMYTIYAFECLNKCMMNVHMSAWALSCVF